MTKTAFAGKTKIVTEMPGTHGIALVTSNNNLSAYDGKRRDVLERKAELATRTTCNVFELLRAHNMPLAYIGRDGPTTFLTKLCTMIPVEVVVRKIATGSYCKRYPDVPDGTVLDPPIVEFFYKTKDKRIGDMLLPEDDPFMVEGMDLVAGIDSGEWSLFNPKTGGHIGQLPKECYSLGLERLGDCASIAVEVFGILFNAWNELDGTLQDFKLEFGVLPNGTLVVADVIDCDSWRVIWHDIKLSKQGFRDGEELDNVLSVYRLAASLTDQFVRMH